jgi:hypothetical protein
VISSPGVERAIPTTLGGTTAPPIGCAPTRGIRIGVALWMAAALAVTGAVAGFAARTRHDSLQKMASPSDAAPASGPTIPSPTPGVAGTRSP